MNSDAKGRGRTTARTATASQRPRDDSSAEHRRKLEALFSGNSPSGNGAAGASLVAGSVAPRRSEERVFSSPRKSLGRSPSEYRLRLERLRIAREPAEIQEAADAFLSHHQLPDDLEILYKVMQHPSERVVREALGQISYLLMKGRLGSGTLLLQDRLRELSARCSEESTRQYIEGVQAQVASLSD